MSRKPRSGRDTAPGEGYVRLRVTHCVACNYESRQDFDVCPNCGAERMNVIVLKHYIKIRKRRNKRTQSRSV